MSILDGIKAKACNIVAKAISANPTAGTSQLRLCGEIEDIITAAYTLGEQDGEIIAAEKSNNEEFKIGLDNGVREGHEEAFNLFRKLSRGSRYTDGYSADELNKVFHTDDVFTIIASFNYDVICERLMKLDAWKASCFKPDDEVVYDNKRYVVLRAELSANLEHQILTLMGGNKEIRDHVDSTKCEKTGDHVYITQVLDHLN